MNVKRIIASLAISTGMLFTAVAVVPAAADAFQYSPDFGRLRGLVDHTQSDVRAAAEFARPGEKQGDRYADTQRALSDLDRHLAKGHFHRGDLDSCIDHLKGILNKTTLQATTRDALMHDVEDLRVARDRVAD